MKKMIIKNIIIGGISAITSLYVSNAIAQTLPSPPNSNTAAWEELQFGPVGGPYTSIPSGSAPMSFTFNGVNVALTDPLGLNPICDVSLTGNVSWTSSPNEVTIVVTSGTINPGDAICNSLSFNPSTFPWTPTVVTGADSPSDALAINPVSGSFGPVDVRLAPFNIAVCGTGNFVPVNFKNGNIDVYDNSYFQFIGAPIGPNCTVTGQLFGTQDVNMY